MLLKCFNCTKCGKPFDCKEGMPNTPISGDTECAACNEGTMPFLALMKFLDQPGFVKTADGYLYKGGVVVPHCIRCKSTQTSLTKAAYFHCGHVFCNECCKEECLACGAKVEENSYWFDHLMRFFDALLDRTMAEETARTADPTCADCNISQPVERLFSCTDCNKWICGVCLYHQHREHTVTPLLGVELTKLKTGAGERYNEKLSGLQNNLKFLHKEVEESIAKVIAVGTKRLNEVDGQEIFVAAKKIATEVDVASDEFEQYCEQYIPVARVFNENLTKLSEKLEGASKD